MNPRIPMIVATHGLLLVGGAYAADRIAGVQQPAAPVEFATLDADQDGTLSRNEARADPTLDAVFRGVDTDGDLRITRDEHAAWTRARREGAKPGTG